MNIQPVRTLLAANAAMLLVLLVSLFGSAWQPLSNALFDFDMSNTKSQSPDEDLLVVTIDDESLKQLGAFPWERDIYVPFLEKAQDAKAIGFDITFFTDGKHPENDRLFAAAVKARKNVVLPVFADTETSLQSTAAIKDGVLQAYGVTGSIPALSDAAANLAHINRWIDEDGAIRRAWLQIALPDGKIVDSLALKLASMHGADVASFRESGNKPFVIKWDAVPKDFNTVSFATVLSKDFPAENFAGRIVLVGGTAVGEDLGITPIHRSMPMVYVHANIINQLLHGEHVRAIDNSGHSGPIILLASLLAFLLSFIMVWRLKPVVSAAAALAAAISLFFAQYALFSYRLVFFDIVYPVAFLLGGYLINTAVKAYCATRQQSHITRQFARYLSPDVVREIVRSGVDIQLGGIVREISVLFLDIRGFTALSEKLKPEEVVDLLNTVFDVITQKALNNKGTIDKFIGDAAMILFNAPLDVPDHEAWAVKAAHAIQQEMNAVQEAVHGKYGVEIGVGIGIGINTGEAVVGNVGSYLRMDYTAIGDNVNVAARIVTHAAAGRILVAETTYERTKHKFAYQFFAETLLAGKTVPSKLYELQDLRHA